MHLGEGGLHPGEGISIVVGGWVWQTHADTWDSMGYGEQVSGTHPTEMLSCFDYFSNLICHIFNNTPLCLISFFSFLLLSI